MRRRAIEAQRSGGDIPKAGEVPNDLTTVQPDDIDSMKRQLDFDLGDVENGEA